MFIDYNNLLTYYAYMLYIICMAKLSNTDHSFFSLVVEATFSNPFSPQRIEIDREILAVLSNGELWVSRLDQINWRRILPEVKDVNAVGFRRLSS